MEVIEDELKKNGVPVDIETISEHINYILNNYRDTYNDSVNLLRLSSNEENVLNVFHQMDVSSQGAVIVHNIHACNPNLRGPHAKRVEMCLEFHARMTCNPHHARMTSRRENDV